MSNLLAKSLFNLTVANGTGSVTAGLVEQDRECHELKIEYEGINACHQISGDPLAGADDDVVNREGDVRPPAI